MLTVLLGADARLSRPDAGQNLPGYPTKSTFSRVETVDPVGMACPLPKAAAQRGLQADPEKSEAEYATSETMQRSFAD